MKKLAFMFVAVVAMSFASCGNKAEKPAEEVEAPVEEVVEDTTAADTTVADSTVADTAAVAE